MQDGQDMAIKRFSGGYKETWVTNKFDPHFKSTGFHLVLVVGVFLNKDKHLLFRVLQFVFTPWTTFLLLSTQQTWRFLYTDTFNHALMYRSGLVDMCAYIPHGMRALAALTLTARIARRL